MDWRSVRAWNVVTCLILASAPAAHGQEMVGAWTVEYQTRAVNVESVDEGLPEGNRRLVIVKLKNVSGRPVTAISLDIENATSTTFMHWKPVIQGATLHVRATLDVRAEPYRRIRVNAVLFGDTGPDSGYSAAASAMRFDRMGGFMEMNRCLAVLRRFEPSKLDSVSVTEILATLEGRPTTLDEALGSLSEDAESEFALRELMKGASDAARQAFLLGVRSERRAFRTAVRNRLLQAAALSDEERGSQVHVLRRQYERDVEALRPIYERDLRAEQTARPAEASGVH